MRLSGFEPVVDGDCRVLVLGTMPGVASLQKQQYYGHPRNAFWPIMAALTEETLPEEYQARKLMLLRHGIALWDVCQSCEREGSLDSNILCEHPNQIVPLLKSTVDSCVGFQWATCLSAFSPTYRKRADTMVHYARSCHVSFVTFTLNESCLRLHVVCAKIGTMDATKRVSLTTLSTIQ